MRDDTNKFDNIELSIISEYSEWCDCMKSHVYLFNDGCLNLMKKLPDKSVQMIYVICRME